MAAGLPALWGDVNRAAGLVVAQLSDALGDAVAFNTMINDTSRGYGSAGLQALAVAGGETSGQATTDAGVIIASFADLANLYKVAHGQQAQPGASDFFFNAKLLMGVKPVV